PPPPPPPSRRPPGPPPARAPPPSGRPPPPRPAVSRSLRSRTGVSQLAPGPRPRGGGVEGLAEFLGDAGERGDARAGERVLGLDFAVLDAVEHLLQAHLHAFVLAA